jgi:hypothetical protein
MDGRRAMQGEIHGSARRRFWLAIPLAKDREWTGRDDERGYLDGVISLFLYFFTDAKRFRATPTVSLKNRQNLVPTVSTK